MANLEVQLQPIAQDPNAVVAELNGVLDGTTVPQFQDALEDARRRYAKLILDMNRVRYVNSAGLGAVVQYADKFKSKGGGLALVRVPAKVRIVMEMLGLQEFLEICAGEQEALAALARMAGGAAPAAAGAPPPAGGSGRFAAPPPPQPAPAGRFAPPPPPPPAGSGFAPVPPPPPSGFGAPTSGTFAPPPPPQPGSGFAPPPPPRPADGKTIVACQGCSIDVELPAPGNWKCPRCRTLITLRPDGSTQFLAATSPAPFELSLACTREGTDALMQFTGIVAHPALAGSQKVDMLKAAVSEVAYVITSACYNWDTSRVFHVSIEAQPSEVTVRFADQGAQLDPSQLQAYFPNASRATDEFELKPHPKGGNLIRLCVRN